MTALFLDTNVLLHFKTFDEIAWHKLAGDDFMIIIAPVVLDEVDKHKNHQVSKLAQRARMIAGKFEQLIDEERPDGKVHFISRRPASGYFDEHQLDPKHQDDQLFAAVIQYRELNPHLKVMLVSADVGVKLKGKTLDIPVIRPGDELRLPDTPDKRNKELEKLQKEITELRKRMPEVVLLFDNGTSCFEKVVNTHIKTFEEYFEEEANKVEQQYPLREFPEFDTEGKTPMEVINIKQWHYMWSATNEGRYTTDVYRYYEDYEKYLPEFYAYSLNIIRSVVLTFQLKNEGTCPAEDIDVWLKLPEGFTVLHRVPQAPEVPSPPGIQDDFEPYVPKQTSPNQPNISDPDQAKIKKTSGYELTYRCEALKHGFNYRLKPVVLQYDSFEAMHNFTIEYRLNIANVPKPVIGQLHLLINKS